MKFLLDESVEFRLASFLKERGHDVTAIAHEYPGALSDPGVLATARQEGRVLITNDTDFGELVYRRGLAHAGVILFRLPAATLGTKMAQLDRILAEHSDDLGSFLVVTERRIRVRRPEPAAYG